MTGTTDKRGTEVRFGRPDHLQQHRVPLRDPLQRLRELSFLNNGVKIRLIDQRQGKEENFAFSGGVKGFVEYINRSKTVLHPNVFSVTTESSAGGVTVGVEVAMQWNDSYSESVLCFTNNIPQRDGGSHLTGLRAAMTRIINKYITDNELAKKAKVETSGDDMREGLACVLSVKVPNPSSAARPGQAGLQRSAPGRRRSRGPHAGNLAAGTPTTPRRCAPRSSRPPAPAKPRARRAR